MTKKPKTGKALSMVDTQRLLRSKPPVPIGKLSLDPLSMTAMATIVRERLVSRGGRPSDPAWVISRKVPMRIETWEQLDRCAQRLQQHIRVSAGQIAAIALERGLPEIVGENISVESIVLSKHDVTTPYHFSADARQKARQWIGPISRHSLFS